MKSFANEDVEMEKFLIGNDGFLNAKRNSYKYMGGFHAGLGAFTTLITIIVLVGGAFFVTKKEVNVSDLVTFVLYIGIFTEPVRKLINFAETFLNGYSGYERFREIMAIEPDIKDIPGAKEMKSANGVIDFENVSFGYEEKNHMVLNRVNLHVPAGQYIALVGASMT